MSLKLNVPTLDSPESAKELEKVILTSEPEATVNVDASSKTVTVESDASEETFKQLIVAAGHKLA
ncbi:MAG: cation transporter [Kaiparowitsia implicata GSE-PSE-MK54-09C]|nr:cation transporter [Kaiparowitsia implicata GSE-PSE-MK54-09C]